ncbi:MAG: hypothetical protein A3F09_02495 [Chlamydiae bacterium RIFCSPHIGHO2_12_FULL_49_11]|nr:MAG: hypothetical protein A3F09_02495 [Chlamydiae bacterium RIFCSPHIGHO2_12_FULL_49_11]
MKKIFYDAGCPFCVICMHFIKKHDPKHQYKMSSIDGKNAKMLFSGNYRFLRKRKTIVFLEGQRVWLRANAIFRVMWNLGGAWKIPGLLCYVPGFLVNPFFRLLALLVPKSRS